ncbi:unnamed protein product [Mytilus coruscus]|uniref:TIR domain-containing protein n=1 Tax=Mytilus coruscus TaxID=42192 RepID=A0A6J8BXX7_MYTCO|nr:unnamed protein product [Mytilus coruscus]
MGIISIIFIKDVLEVLKLFLVNVIERSGVSKDELYRRVNNSNLRCLSLKTKTDLDGAIIKGAAADIIEISTLIIHLNIASDFGKGSEFEGKLYDDVRAVRRIRNDLKHAVRPLSNEECYSYLEELKNLAVKFESHLNASPNEYIHLVHEISNKRRQHLIWNALRKKYTLQKIQLTEERALDIIIITIATTTTTNQAKGFLNPFQCVDLNLSEVQNMTEEINERDDSKMGPMQNSVSLDNKTDEWVEKDCDAERNKTGRAETKIQTMTSVDREDERLFEKCSENCEIYALPHPINNESRQKTTDKKMIPSNTVWHKTEKYVKLKEQKSFQFIEDTVDILFIEEEGKMNNYINLKEDLEETGMTMMSSREVSLPGRPVLPKLTKIKPSVFLLENETMCCLQAYQLQVGLKYHNKATCLLLSQLERVKKPSIQIRKSGLSGNYEYDLLLCYCPYDREKATRIKSWINAAIDDVRLELYEDVTTPGHFPFLQARSKRFIILITKNMMESRTFIHEVDMFIVRMAMENHIPQDLFVLLVDDKSLVPPSLIPIKQIPLQDMEEKNQDFIDWCAYLPTSETFKEGDLPLSHDS